MGENIKIEDLLPFKRRDQLFAGQAKHSKLLFIQYNQKGLAILFQWKEDLV